MKVCGHEVQAANGETVWCIKPDGHSSMGHEYYRAPPELHPGRRQSEETNRWWQAFCACLRAWPAPSSSPPEDIAFRCADRADAAIEEARKRGRL